VYYDKPDVIETKYDPFSATLFDNNDDENIKD